MALESKPLFHPEVLRQHLRAFNLPQGVADWQPKLQHWAGLIASGRADDFNETALLPDFFADIFCGRATTMDLGVAASRQSAAANGPGGMAALCRDAAAGPGAEWLGGKALAVLLRSTELS